MAESFDPDRDKYEPTESEITALRDEVRDAIEKEAPWITCFQLRGL